MTHTIEAVFENGAFRPIDPIDLDNGQHVKLVVEVSGKDPLALTQAVYDGLTEEEIDEVEKIALDRTNFFAN